MLKKVLKVHLDNFIQLFVLLGCLQQEIPPIHRFSPALLEKLLIEMMYIFRQVKEGIKKYMVIDSLSALMIYNNPETVKEFFQHFINKTRAEDIHSISIVVEEEMDENMNRIMFLNEKIIKVRESFI